MQQVNCKKLVISIIFLPYDTQWLISTLIFQVAEVNSCIPDLQKVVRSLTVVKKDLETFRPSYAR